MTEKTISQNIINILKNEEGNYVFSLGDTYNSQGLFKINENIHKISKKEIFSSKEVPVIVKLTEIKRKRKYLSLCSDRPDLFPDGYDKKLFELTKNATKSGNDFIFDDLEEEFEYKKFIRDYKLVEDNVFQELDIFNVIINDKKESLTQISEEDSKYLSPTKGLDHNYFSDLYIFNKDLYFKNYVIERFTKLGYEVIQDQSVSYWDLKSLRSIGIKFQEKYHLSFFGKDGKESKILLEGDCLIYHKDIEKQKDSIKKKIDEVIDQWISMHDASENILDNIARLEKIMNKLHGISVLKSSSSDKQSLINFISNEINKLKSLEILDKNKKSLELKESKLETANV